MSIATDASPAIEHLTDVREQLLQIIVVAATAIDRSTDGARFDPAELTRSLALLHRDLSAYRMLPFYPREEILYAKVEEKVRVFEERLAEFSAFVREGGSSRGASKALRTRLLPATAEADAGIADLTSFNAEQQHRLGIEIPRARSQAARVGFMLQLLTGLLGLLLTGLVVLGTRRYTRVVQAQRRAAEDQARSIAAFGSKLESIIGSCADIAGAITSAGDPVRVLQLIADAARTVVGAPYAAVGLRDRSRATVRPVDLLRHAGKRHHHAGPSPASGGLVGGGRPRWTLAPRLRGHPTSPVPRASEGAPPTGIVPGGTHRSRRPERGQPVPGACARRTSL